MSIRRSSIHRKLIFRLTAASLVLATLMGTIAFQFIQRQLQYQFVDTVRVGIEVLRTEIRGRVGTLSGAAAEQSFKQAVENLVGHSALTDLGDFAYAALYDNRGHEVGYATRSSEAEVRRFREILAPLQPDGMSAQTELGSPFRVGQRHGLPFILAVTDERDQTAGYGKGIFVLSPQTEAYILRTTWGAAALAVIFVFATTLIVFPLMRGLLVKLEQQTELLLYANVDTIKVLGSAIAKRDSDTDTHNYRVTFYSVRLAEAIGLDEPNIRSLIKGAFLHDVGKIAIRDTTLLKPGRLNTEEFTEMQSHVRHGLEIVENAGWLSDAGQVIGGHHEKYDGSGYPDGLAGEAIPITARIFAIADVFDALTSARPYKEAVPPDQSLAILREGAGRHFDPALLEAFEPLAPVLYATMSQQEDALRATLDEVIRPYLKNMLREAIDEAIDT